mgnify:CR=1 FL=1
MGGEKEPSLPLREMGLKQSSIFSFLSQINQLSSNKDLLLQLTKREIAAKYRQSLLGLSWSVIEPVLLAITYYFLFVILRGNSDPMYAVWILLGVLTWGCFSKTTLGVVSSLSTNSSTIQAVYFPRVIFPCVAMLSNVRITLLSSLVIIPIMIVAELSPNIYLVLVPIAIFMSGVLAFGVGMMFAPLNCINRDFEHLFRFITRAGFFLSPVMWTIDLVATKRGLISEFVMYNPMVVPLTLIRDGVAGNPPSIDLFWISYSILFTVISWVIGSYIFERNQAAAVKYL